MSALYGSSFDPKQFLKDPKNFVHQTEEQKIDNRSDEEKRRDALLSKYTNTTPTGEGPVSYNHFQYIIEALKNLDLNAKNYFAAQKNNLAYHGEVNDREIKSIINHQRNSNSSKDNSFANQIGTDKISYDASRIVSMLTIDYLLSTKEHPEYTHYFYDASEFTKHKRDSLLLGEFETLDNTGLNLARSYINVFNNEASYEAFAKVTFTCMASSHIFIVTINNMQQKITLKKLLLDSFSKSLEAIKFKIDGKECWRFSEEEIEAEITNFAFKIEQLQKEKQANPKDQEKIEKQIKNLEQISKALEQAASTKKTISMTTRGILGHESDLGLDGAILIADFLIDPEISDELCCEFLSSLDSNTAAILLNRIGTKDIKKLAELLKKVQRLKQYRDLLTSFLMLLNAEVSAKIQQDQVAGIFKMPSSFKTYEGKMREIYAIKDLKTLVKFLKENSKDVDYLKILASDQTLGLKDAMKFHPDLAKEFNKLIDGSFTLNNEAKKTIKEALGVTEVVQKIEQKQEQQQEKQLASQQAAETQKHQEQQVQLQRSQAAEVQAIQLQQQRAQEAVQLQAQQQQAQNPGNNVRSELEEYLKQMKSNETERQTQKSEAIDAIDQVRSALLASGYDFSKAEIKHFVPMDTNIGKGGADMIATQVISEHARYNIEKEKESSKYRVNAEDRTLNKSQGISQEKGMGMSLSLSK